MTNHQQISACSIVNVDAGHSGEAAQTMRDLGYCNTKDIPIKAPGITASDLAAYGIVPTMCRFTRSGKFVANAYYWHESQHIAIIEASIHWLEAQRKALEQMLIEKKVMVE